MSIRLFNNSGGYIDLNAGGDGTAANVFTLPAETGTLITTAGVPKAALPTGSVLQVVSATYSTVTSSASSSFVDTGLTATITPTSATSKILILIDHSACWKQSSDTFLKIKLFRESTEISFFLKNGGYTASEAQENIGSCSIGYLDSPSTTSATIYKTQFASHSNTSLVGINRDDSMSTITLMEIAA